MLKGFTRYFKPLEVLTEQQVEAIHQGIMTVLEDTGVRFEHKRALDIFKKAGCKVDEEDMRVRIPPGLVREALNKCPTSFRLRARDPKHDVVVGGNVLHFASAPGMQRADLDTWEPRDATRQEFYDAVRIYDALENFHIFHGNSPHFSFEGVHPLMATIETRAARVRNSTKVSNLGGTPLDTDIFKVQIAQVVGEEPLCTLPASPPLTWAEDACIGGIRCLEAGLPMMFASGDIYGATSPSTLAGAVVHNSATLMAAIVLTQLLRPGRGVMAANFTWPQNMRTGGPFFGNIAVSLNDAAFNQVWRRYGIPVGNLEAGIPNAKCIDFQNGYERAMQAFASGVAGANKIWFYGCVHGELMSHPLQAILDDDIAGMVGRFLEGIQVSDETLAIDLIGQVGPIPGYYLDKKHTRDWWAKEQFVPKAGDMSALQEWNLMGKKTCVDLARERMEEILATHEPTPLTPAQHEDIDRILGEAKEYFKKRM